MPSCTPTPALNQHWAAALRGLIHKRKGIAIRVTEECHPEVVILPGRDQVGSAGESCAALLKFANNEGVRTAAVDWGTGRRCPPAALPFSNRSRTPLQ